MLPHLMDRAETQLSQYASNNPPCVPRVPVMPDAEPVLVFAAAAVANEASRVATQSMARMFCYNCLAENGWNNPQFAEVVKLACDAAVIRVRSNQATTVGSIIVESAIEVLTLYASMLVISYTDLARALPQEAVNSAANNHRVYTDLVEDSAMMYNQLAGVAYAQPPHPSTHFQPRVGSTQVAHANPVARAAYQGIGQPAVNERPLPSSVIRAQQAPVPVAVVATAPVKPEEPNELTGAIENMDRNAHAIAYYGKEYTMPTAPLRRNLEVAVETFEELAAKPSDEVSVNVNQVVFASLFMDEMIAVSMAEWAELPQDGLAIYMRQGWVVTPIISSISLERTFDELKKCATFAAIATTLQKVIEEQTDKTELHLTLCYIGQIDRLLTKTLNEFLGNMTDLGDFKVGSFVEDAPVLSRYLNEKYKGKYNSAYTEFQKKVICKLFSNTKNSEDALAAITEGFDGAHCDFLTQAYSLTYISATAQELGYTAKKTPKFITANSTPMLRRLVKALTTYELARDMPPNHLVILADGTRYALYQVAGMEDGFTLTEV